MWTNIDDALATYRLLIRDGDVDPAEALASVMEDCDEATAQALYVAVTK